MDGYINRLNFLFEEFNDAGDFCGPQDVWYCFEEARHSFMVGNFVAAIAVSAITIERWLAYLLSIPFYDCPGKKEQQNIAEKQTLGKLNTYAHKIGLINDSHHHSIKRLNNLRTNFIHGINPNNHKRPQAEHSFKYSLENPQELGVDASALEDDAKEAILIMFDFYKEHMYLVKDK